MKSGSISKRQIPPPSSLDGKEVHFCNVVWADEDTFIVQWLNRVQNETIVVVCHVDSIQDCSELFSYKASNGCGSSCCDVIEWPLD
jgi:hypothetical protein